MNEPKPKGRPRRPGGRMNTEQVRLAPATIQLAEREAARRQMYKGVLYREIIENYFNQKGE